MLCNVNNEMFTNISNVNYMYLNHGSINSKHHFLLIIEPTFCLFPGHCLFTSFFS